MSSRAPPVLRQADGQELALGPLEHALVQSVLAVVVRMRRERGYVIELHVKGRFVGVLVRQHIAEVEYDEAGPEPARSAPPPLADRHPDPDGL